MDIHKISVGLVMTKLDQFGSEDFKIDRDYLFMKEWEVLLKTREDLLKQANEVLLMDLKS